MLRLIQTRDFCRHYLHFLGANVDHKALLHLVEDESKEAIHVDIPSVACITFKENGTMIKEDLYL